MQNIRFFTIDELLTAVRNCRICEHQLPYAPRPIVQVGQAARILIAGQAPGIRAHTSGIPWDDPSGERLRTWMGLDRRAFYNDSLVAIIPMGYCYPGRGTSGDLPPRRECAAMWHDHLLAKLPHIELTLLVGQYAQRHFLPEHRKATLTETVMAWQEYAPAYLPLPHPSGRNARWFHQNPWFEADLLPMLRKRIKSIVNRTTPL